MLLLFITLLSAASCLAAFASDSDTILPGRSISGSQTLVSMNGVFELGFFSPGPGIHYYLGIRFKNLVGTSPIFWVGDRATITDLPNASLELFAGNLYIKEAGAVLWRSGVAGNGSLAAVAVLLDDGNFVVRGQGNSSLVIWQSFDSPGDSLLPGARLGLDKNTGRSISLTFQDTSYDNCTLRVDQSRKNGFVISTDGHSDLGTFPDWMVSSEDDGSLLRLKHSESPNYIEFLQLSLGQLSLLRWSVSAGISCWEPRWMYPSDCKDGGFFCGNFGVCTTGGKCGCVDGFRPSYPIEWGLGYFAAGCSRSFPLSCATNPLTTDHNDSFVLLDRVQGLPYNPDNEYAGSHEGCRAACLSKCYCVAYSYCVGCKLWYQKLYNLSLTDRPPYSKIYVRVGSDYSSKKGLHTREVVLLIIGSLVVLVMVVIVLVLFWRYKRTVSMARQFRVEGFLVVYSYSQIKKATKNFSDKLGEGGFGSVFKGTMSGLTVVAVKKLKGLWHEDKQFRAEVKTIGTVRHTNLVRLLGFCAEGSRRLLVYEYMANGSLDTHLFSDSSSVLSWNLRYRIVLGVAKGLAYLHEECNDCIIHCDIKPENVLLDAEFRPKIADFGMAKLLGRDFSSALTTIRGTIGYLAPEWISRQAITHKADVYSFGIVFFEIISGRRATEKMKRGEHRYFPFHAAVKVNEGEVLCLLDGRLEGSVDVEELSIACRVACWCIQDNESHRPSMGQVVLMLERVVGTELPPIPASFQNLMDVDNDGVCSDLVEG